MKINVIEYEDNDVYVNGEYVGELLPSVGPYGESTGRFKECKTVSPLNELFKGENMILVNRWDIELPEYL